MYCPYCSYTSFDDLPVCPRCNYDWSKERQQLGLDCFLPPEPQEKTANVFQSQKETIIKGQGLTTAPPNDFTGKE